MSMGTFFIRYSGGMQSSYFVDLKDNFLNFVIKDQVGKISNHHMAFADSKANGANSPECMKLAGLFAVAIDCAKTGKTIEIPEDLCATEYPDFMGLKPSYPAKGILGTLYTELGEKVTKHSTAHFYNEKMEVEGMGDYVDNAVLLKEEYDAELKSLINTYGVNNERQLFLYNKGDDNSFLIQQRLQALVDKVIYKFRESDCENELAKASAWYHVTHHPKHKNGLISFPWCIHKEMIRIKNPE
ncbi:RNA-dependent RNA polymerase, eukaryotic-type [Corchorus olitorius]|uniref:RNA-dependent RNA polymerase n=1 Tax=Corchorus olitorius TaxID=93759 RepID=A0A1R3H5Z2_9ROSI|nr:RNA-dependent RNA polymerase, eukaryotic-type [Corchorus olitorius]